MELENKNLIDFIACYRSHSVLWDTALSNYMEKSKKEQAYYDLLQVYKELRPKAQIADVKRKINTLRCNYRREWRKKFTTSNYTPTLWWYDLLDFLDDVLEKPKEVTIISKEEELDQNEDDTTNSSNPLKPTKRRDKPENNLSFERSFQPMVAIPLSPRSSNGSVSQSISHSRKPDYKKRKYSSSSMHRTYENLDDIDEAEVFTRSWIVQYRQLSKDQKIFAKKAIEDVLFEARLSTLHRNSVKINDNLCLHCQQAFGNDIDDVEHIIETADSE